MSLSNWREKMTPKRRAKIIEIIVASERRANELATSQPLSALCWQQQAQGLRQFLKNNSK